MKMLLGVAVAALAISFAAVAESGVRARAEAHVHNFVLSTECEGQSGAPNAWFLIPEAGEVAQRLSEHGAPAIAPIQIWIDLSLSDNEFADGTYLGTGPFSSPVFGTSSFIWSGLLPGRLHYYRLNALVGDAWFLIGSGMFETPDCVTVRDVRCYAFWNAAVSFVTAPSQSIAKGTAAVQQWLDLSLVDNGFAPGTFVATGPLPPSGTSFLWPDILPARRHYFRVDTNYAAAGWRATATGSFLSLDCIGMPNNISLPL